MSTWDVGGLDEPWESPLEQDTFVGGPRLDPPPPDEDDTVTLLSPWKLCADCGRSSFDPERKLETCPKCNGRGNR